MLKNTAISSIIALILLSTQVFAAVDPNQDPFAQFKNNAAPTQQAAGTGGASAPIAPIVIPNPPVFEAEAWVLMDYATGQVLFEQNGHKKIWPASLTKMMTSYVIGMEIKAGRLKLDDDVVITEDAWSKNYSDSSKMFIEVGKKIKVDDLNKGIIIQSGNDACVAMAIHLAGSEEGFVSVMNQYAAQLGLTNTHFANVHGLFDEQNYSTAYDMALLGRALIRDLPNEYAIYKEKEFRFNGIRQYNRNRLLWDTSLNVDGIKTGHLSQVGYNLVASSVNGNMRLIASVIGAKSEKARANFCRQMLNYGFRYFEYYNPLKPNQVVLQREVKMGDKNMVDLAVEGNTNGVIIPRGNQQNIKINYQLNSSQFVAPIAKGQELGVIRYQLDGRTLASYPLIANEEIKEGGFFSKLWDRIMMFFTSNNDGE